MEPNSFIITVNISRRMINEFAKVGYYYWKTEGKTHNFKIIDSDTIDNAIEWWHNLSIMQYLNTIKNNPHWMNKGETGIIHMYINRPK